MSNQHYRNNGIDERSHFVTGSVAGFASPLLSADSAPHTVLRGWLRGGEALRGRHEYMHSNRVKRALVVEPGRWAWSKLANCYGGEPVLRIAVALSFDEAVVRRARDVAAGFEVGGGRNTSAICESRRIRDGLVELSESAAA